MIEYRFLPQEEWQRLQLIFNEYGGQLPEAAEIVVAENEGEIVGMQVLQLVAHAEPLWIKEPYRGKVSWKRMLSMLDTLFSSTGSYFVFSPNNRIERMAQLAGMTQKDWTIWERKVN